MSAPTERPQATTAEVVDYLIRSRTRSITEALMGVESDVILMASQATRPTNRRLPTSGELLGLANRVADAAGTVREIAMLEQVRPPEPE